MHLQSLELLGFKSFPDKTILNFHEGVTAIVGPNGCGKSNILDAVRWVLGEQSAKAMRGTEMADVIFNGTDARKPVGFGEVSLTFTDCGSELGVDWHEVRVTRRVYRDGLSEYFLNKNLCRLKDIHTLFADTGIGRSAYSIMEQGRIDLILSARPEDRRTVFEEAAGITKYKGQKREALRKLEATEANLLRLGDIIREVKRQIGSLQRQAGKARRYQGLLADLQVLDTHHSRDQLARLENDLERSRETTRQLAEQQDTTERAIEEQENEIAEERASLEQIDARINEARSEVQRLQNQIASHRNRIEFNREREQELLSLIERYERDIATAETKLAQQESEIHDTDALLEQMEKLLASKQAELEQLTESAGTARREREERERETQALELTISKEENRLADLEEEIAGTKTRRAATEPRLRELVASLGKAVQERDSVSARLDAVRATAAEREETLEELAAKISLAENELAVLQRELREGDAALLASDRAVAERQSRLEILRQLRDEGEGLAQGSQALLKGLDDPSRILPGVIGALANLIEVDEQFIPAIEAALGRGLHAIVLRDAKLASEIVAKLTGQKLGQTALVAPELLAPVGDERARSLPEGAIAWATEKVHAPGEIQPLVRHLLGEVVLVDDLELALRLRKQRSDLAFVTLSGAFISREGIIFGGNLSEEKTSLLARQNQLKTLAAEHRALLEEQEKLRARHEKIQRRLATATERLEAIRENHQKARGDHSAALLEIASLERDLHEASRKGDAIEWEKTTLEQQLAAATERIAQLEQDAKARRVSLDKQRAQRSAAQSLLEAARLRDEESSEQLSQLRLAVATEQHRHETLRTQRQPMTARQKELADLIATRRADIAAYQDRREQQARETAAAERSIEAKSAELSAAESTVAEITETRAAQLTKINARESGLRAGRKTLSDLHDARGKEEVRQTQVQLKIENLIEHVTRRYQIDLRAFAPDRYAFSKTLRAQLKRRAKKDLTALSSQIPGRDEGDAKDLAGALPREANGAGAGTPKSGAGGLESGAGTPESGAGTSESGAGAAKEEKGGSRERMIGGEADLTALSSQVSSSAEDTGRERNLRGEASAEEAVEELDEAALVEMIAELTRQLDAMGPVNLDAVQEYDELEDRHRFLEKQNGDLTTARRELLDVIARINQTTEKLFAETFAQVRINFREMFAELFGGGRADLRLLDEADALNCGIEIIAKPPGKQLQNISLLSGGERTMTAVALLFAIYMVRPSPFCILDEMDAPLDESNINRFIRVLDRFVRQSQFIIITHNKRTIARSDILYGITMEERGVSKLVGMRLSDAKRDETNLPVATGGTSAQQTLPIEQRSEREQEENLALTR